MAKPTRVRYSGSAPFIDDTQANRVQALGSSSRLTTEDIKELGTLNIAEIVDDVPQVDVSIDANENGTMELLALFSNKGYGCQVVAVPSGTAIGSLQVRVKPGSFYAKGNRVNFSGTTLTVASSGNQSIYLNPDISTSSTLAGVGTSVPGGAIKIADIVVTGGIVSQANITDQRPFNTIHEVDLETAKTSIFVPVKQTGTGDVVARTMYVENAYLNSMDLNFQVTGLATASYKLETDNKRWFLNDKAQFVVDEFKLTTVTAVPLSQTPTQLANGNYILSAVKNGTPLVEGVDFTVAGQTLTLSVAPTAGDLLKLRYATAVGGKFFAPVPAMEDPHPELAGGLRNGQVEIYLVDNQGVVDTTRATRIQTARISAPFTRQPLSELGTMHPYDRPLQLPITSSVTLDLKDSDLEFLARFAGYANLSAVDEIALDDIVKNKGVLVKIYRESDVKRAKLPAGHPDKYAVKTVYIKNLIPQNEAWDVRIDSDATQNFTFQAHNITVSDKYTL